MFLSPIRLREKLKNSRGGRLGSRDDGIYGAGRHGVEL